MLIAHGHTLDAVKGYTIAQVAEFLGAIERMTAEKRIGDAVTARMAQAEGKAWKGYLKQLENGAHGRP